MHAVHDSNKRLAENLLVDVSTGARCSFNDSSACRKNKSYYRHLRCRDSLSHTLSDPLVRERKSANLKYLNFPQC